MACFTCGRTETYVWTDCGYCTSCLYHGRYDTAKVFTTQGALKNGKPQSKSQSILERWRNHVR